LVRIGKGEFCVGTHWRRVQTDSYSYTSAVVEALRQARDGAVKALARRQRKGGQALEAWVARADKPGLLHPNGVPMVVNKFSVTFGLEGAGHQGQEA
jgi:hypothetical protein